MQATIFESATGEIKMTFNSIQEEDLVMNISPTQDFITGCFSAEQYYIEDGVAKAKEERPSHLHSWNPVTKMWEDLRTETEWVNTNNSNREKSSISRIDFVLRCKDANILTEEEGLIAVKGNFPPTFQTIVDSMPEEERFEAAIRWAGATVIDRTNSLIVSMAAAIGIDEWILDTIFNVVWPEPLPSWPTGQLHPIYEE